MSQNAIVHAVKITLLSIYSNRLYKKYSRKKGDINFNFFSYSNLNSTNSY